MERINFLSLEEELEHEKEECVEIARELYYPVEVIRQIKNAKSVREISKIMQTARTSESTWERYNSI